MAIIDVVSYQANDNEFIYKFPSDDLRLGTQLVVGVSQVTFFVKGGKIYDQYEGGTHTLKSENIPLLNKLINLPFGNSTPFKAEVFYVNLISKLDIKWGTPIPIQLEDPKYGIIVPVRAFGQYGIRIKEPRTFLELLVGNINSFSSDKINDYFKGKILSSLSSLISSKLILQNVSILEINALLDDMSEFALNKLQSEFIKYGIELVSFNFISINVPENDPSYQKLKESKDLAAKIRIIGRDVYQMDRSFDVLDKASQNESSPAGSLIGAGIGVGAGIGIGSQLGNMVGNFNTNVPPPLPSTQFHVLINNQQNGPFDLNRIREFIIGNIINKNTLVWKQGMQNWDQAGSQIELIQFFNSNQFTPPPPPPPFNS